MGIALAQEFRQARAKIACVLTGVPRHLKYLERSLDLAGGSGVLQLVDGAEGEDAAERAFRRHYVHLSSNPEPFELFCFTRWFSLLRAMEQGAWSHALHVDSDVIFAPDLIGADIGLGHPQFSLCLAHNPDFSDLASGHVSLWSRDDLSRFCELLTTSYADARRLEELRLHFEQSYRRHRPGGISDMTILRQFWEDHANRRNFLIPQGDRACGHNMNTDESGDERRYRMSGGLCDVRASGRRFNAKLGGRPTSLWALHFQGRAKHLMRYYVDERDVVSKRLALWQYSAVKAARAVRNKMRFTE